MKIKKLGVCLSLLIVLLFAINISSLSAVGWDNKLTYSNEDLKVELTNWFGLGSDYGTAELKSHKSVDEVLEFGYGKEEVVMFYDFDFLELYENGLGEVYFKDERTGKEIEKDYSFVYWTNETYGKDIYEYQCSKSVNGTNICESIFSGKEIKNREVWKPYTSRDIQKGKIRIGLKTYVNEGDLIDGVWTIAGKKIEKHAVWSSGLNVGLTHYYKLNETSGLAIDSLGTTNLTNNGATQGAVGLINNSYDFDGASDYLSSLPANTLTSSGFSITMWVNNDTVPSAYFFGAQNAGTNGFLFEYGAGCGAGNLGFTAFGGGGGSICVATILDSDWNMVTVTYDGADYSIYQDALNVGNLTASFNQLTVHTYFIGARSLTGSANTFFDGRIDEVGFWNRSLSQDEIIQLYNEGVGITWTDIFLTTLNSPIDFFNTTNQTIIFNGTTSESPDNVTLFIDDVGNETNSSGVSGDYIFTKIISEGVHTWNYETCDPLVCQNATERTFTMDQSSPIINITFPTEIIDYHEVNTNLSVNWTISDLSLDTCILQFEGVNRTVTCLDNQTEINITNNVNKTIIFYANDTLGNINSSSRTWDYQIFEINQTFNSPVVELSTQEFELFINVGGDITNVNLFYNGTNHSSNIFDLGGDLSRIETSFQIPNFNVDTNVSFYYNFSILNGENIITNNETQEVIVLILGNCSTQPNLLLNLSLFDENLLTPIVGSIETNLDILNQDGITLISSISANFYNITNATICSNLNLTSGDQLYNLEIRYYSDPLNDSNFLYAPEFYHIQKASTNNFPQTINLFDLNINESTEFTIFYRDNDYVARENVLLQILRKYVDEGIFRVVEIPITSNEGSAVGHFDLNNYKYKIIATQDGEVLNIFDNPAVRCESELSGICEIILKGLAETPQADFVSDLENFFYSINQTNDSVIINYVIPSGESEQVNIVMIQTSPFKDSTIICNQTILSSAGQIECGVNSTIGDSNVQVQIKSNQDTKGNLIVTFQEDLNSTFLLNNYFIAIVILMTLITMVVSSPQLMVWASIFGLVFSGIVFLLKYETVGLVVGAIGWLIVSGIIVSIKLNKKAES